MTDQKFQYHEHSCAKDKSIIVPTYPGSEKTGRIEVCAECESEYTSTQRDSAIMYFQPETEPKLENEFMR